MVTNIVLLVILCVITLLLAVGLVFAFIYARTKLTKQVIDNHRQLWIYYNDNFSDLGVIFDNAQKTKGLTEKQSMFLVMLFNHLQVLYQMKRVGLLAGFTLNEDVKDILSYKTVVEFWETNKKFRNKKFVSFVDGYLTK